jgi:hypothetical protein
MKRMVGRLTPVLAVVALAAALLTVVPQPASAATTGWQNPDRHLTITDPDGGSLRPGDTVKAALSGFVPSSTVQLAVCLDDVFTFGGASAPTDQGCTPRTPVTVDAMGAALVDYQLDPNLQVTLDGKCGLTTWNYYASCSVIAFEGSPLLSVTDAALHFNQGGTASVSGNVLDDPTGTPLATPNSVSICRDGGSDCQSTNTSTGSYSFGSLPAGTYAVRATPGGNGCGFSDGSGSSFSDGSGSSFSDGSGSSFSDGSGSSFSDGSGFSTGSGFSDGSGTSFGQGCDTSGSGTSFGGGFGFSFVSNAVGVAVADGASAANIDVPLASNGATNGPVGYRGATLTYAPATPAWNDTISVSAGGFRPDHQVNIALCGADLVVNIHNGHLSTCDGTLVTADSSGNATLDIPYTADRFHGTCSLSACVVVAHETDLDGKGRWSAINFTAPTGNATISGVVTLDGSPITDSANVQSCGPVGCTSRSAFGSGFSFAPAGGGSFTLPAPADGDYKLTATYYFAGHQISGTATVTVSGQQSVTGVELALDKSTLPTGAISGTVADAEGDPLPNATVEGCQSSMQYCGASATTDSQGHYRLPYLADGDWQLILYSSDAAINGLKKTATVSGGAETTGVDFVVPIDIGTGSITVHLVDVNGQLLPGYISTCGASPQPCRFGSRQPDGTEILRYLPDGTYVVTANDITHYAVGSATVTVTGGGNTDVTITLPVAIGGGSIAGTVRDSQGHPLSGAAVTVCATVACTNVASNNVGPDGTYLRTDLPDGSYDVTATNWSTNETATRTVTIASGAHLTGIDLTLGAPTQPNDTTPPTISIVAPVDGATYHRGDVVPASYTCADQGGSGLATCNGTVPTGSPIDTSTLGTKTFTVNATDGAGNPASQTVTYTVDDATPPTANVTVSPTPNGAGWVNTAATVTLDAADEAGGSGLAALTLGGVSGTQSPLTTTVTVDGTTTLAYSATDVAGNVTTGVVTVNVDRTAPTVTINTPAAGTTVTQGATVIADYSCDDATSGIASCVGSVPNGSAIDTSTPGTKTLSITATDVAGNTTTVTRTVTVTAPAPKDHVALSFSGAITAHYDADLTGQITIRRTRGQVTSATASGTLPGAAGGTATIRLEVHRLWITPLFIGVLRITDPSTHLSQTTLIFGNVTASGSQLTGTNRWFTAKHAPYTLKWTITDAG